MSADDASTLGPTSYRAGDAGCVEVTGLDATPSRNHICGENAEADIARTEELAYERYKFAARQLAKATHAFKGAQAEFQAALQAMTKIVAPMEPDDC